MRHFYCLVNFVIVDCLNTSEYTTFRKDVIVGLHFGVSYKCSINKGYGLITSETRTIKCTFFI